MKNLIFVPLILFAAINNLSDVSLVAPYKFIGAQALSLLKVQLHFLRYIS